MLNYPFSRKIGFCVENKVFFGKFLKICRHAINPSEHLIKMKTIMGETHHSFSVAYFVYKGLGDELQLLKNEQLRIGSVSLVQQFIDSKHTIF